MSTLIKTKLKTKGTLISKLCTRELFSPGNKSKKIFYWIHQINDLCINIFSLYQKGEITIQTFKKLSNLPKK